MTLIRNILTVAKLAAFGIACYSAGAHFAEPKPPAYTWSKGGEEIYRVPDTAIGKYNVALERKSFDCTKAGMQMAREHLQACYRQKLSSAVKPKL